MSNTRTGPRPSLRVVTRLKPVRSRRAPSVGQPVLRIDGLAKVRGEARFVDDFALPGMLYGRTIRSAIPCGRIRAIHCDFRVRDFVLVEARDIPGRNVVALIDDDQPFLADGVVRHVAEPILLLAHEDPERLLAAKVEIDYEPAEPTFDPETSPTAFKTIAIEKGKPAWGFANADLVLEGEYRTAHQEQLYIEPNGVIAIPGEHSVTVHGSMQCPYYVHRALRVLLGLPEDRVRVVQAETGGAFGGKEEYPSILAGHAALLALKAGRPVKMVYDRIEDMLATTKRHPAIVRHRTGVTRDGRITAMEIHVVMDGGAYATLSSVVLSRGLLHATGPYRCDHVRVAGRVMMTNTPPNGAFRGFGAPQTQFAAEVHMDRLAEAVGLDPARFRERNLLRPGDTLPTGQRLGRDCSAGRVLREAVKRTDFRRRRRQMRGTARSLGLSLFFHGAGFTGSGEVTLASKAALALTPRGVRVLASSAEMGQGSRTVHTQIVADTLGWPLEAVEIAQVDTGRVPDSGPTVASRTSMVVGGLLERCARDVLRKLAGMSPRDYLRRHGPLTVTRQYEPPPGGRWDEARYRGDAYATYAWGCNVVEVELDPVTCEVRPVRVTAVVDIGRALNPALAAGQVEGGTAQALGWALLEDVVMRDGRMVNSQLTNYIIPTSKDTPPIDVALIENRYRHGPFGAKGLGELPMDGPAPAVVNAIRALGIDIRRIPATPERILEAMSRTAGGLFHKL